MDSRSILLRVAGEARNRPARPLAPPPPPSALATAAYAVFLCGSAAFVLVVLNLHLFLPDGTPVAVFQLAVGGILLLVGLALAFDRLALRPLLRARRAWRLHQAGQRARWSRLTGAMLTLLGIAWVAAGVLNVVRGVDALL
jgi:hypothetical protein